jgi:hypothetical protein
VLISTKIPNLINGVSQQAAPLRLPSQGEVQINGLSTITRGLTKRPPIVHVQKLANTVQAANSFIHQFNIGQTDAERYFLVIGGGAIKVFTASGVECGVGWSGGMTNTAVVNYITSETNPATAFRAMTVGDTTIIVNRNRTVTAASGSSSHPAAGHLALFTVRQGAYGRTYRINLSGVERSHTTPDGSVAAHTALIDTSTIAEQLRVGLAQLIGLTVGSGTISSVTRVGNMILVRGTGAFTARAEDGMGGAGMTVVKDKVNKFSDLPAARGFANITDFVVQVDEAAEFNGEYWVKLSTDGLGTWKEAPAPGSPLGLAQATMPLRLVRTNTTTFFVEFAPWTWRQAGSATNNPDPSFVNNKIEDLFYHKGRLGFISDESVILSDANDPWNFFRTTLTQLLDSDPIDIVVSNNEVSKLRNAVTFNKQLILFSENHQFEVEGGDILTPNSASLTLVSDYENDPNVRPISSGNSVFFPVNRGVYASLHEYVTTTDTNLNVATEITSHVPRYVPSNLKQIIASSALRTVVAIPSELGRVYVYRYFDEQGSRLQSSWSEWNFGGSIRILGAAFVDASRLFIVYTRSDGTFMGYIRLAEGEIETHEPHPIHLDFKMIGPTAATLTNGRRRVTILGGGHQPTAPLVYKAFVLEGPKAGEVRDVYYEVVNASTTHIQVDSDIGANNRVVIGSPYDFTYEFSPQYPRMGDAPAETNGRFSLRYLQMNVTETGQLDVIVHPQGRDPTYVGYDGYTTGVTNVGSYSLTEKPIRVPVLGDARTTRIVLSSPSILPLAVYAVDIEGQFIKRSRGV